MNEKNKMINGDVYNPGDSELVKDRLNCKKLCQKYNSILPDKTEERKNILKEIFGKIGNNPRLSLHFGVITGTILKRETIFT